MITQYAQILILSLHNATNPLRSTWARAAAHVVGNHMSGYGTLGSGLLHSGYGTLGSLGFAGHTLFASGYVCSLCFPLVHALDTAPRLSSTSLLDRYLVIVISFECARRIYSLTLRLASGCAPNFARCLSPCSLDKLSVFPLSFVTVPSLSRSYNTYDPPPLPH